MKSLVTVALLCACFTVCSASPVAEAVVHREVDWELAKTTTTQFEKLVALCFDGVRYIINQDETNAQFIITEKIINTQSLLHRVFVIVLDHIDRQDLTCDHVKFYAEEVIGTAVDLVNYLFGTDISEKSKRKIRNLWNPTYIDAELMAKNVARLLGCAGPH